MHQTTACKSGHINYFVGHRSSRQAGRRQEHRRETGIGKRSIVKGGRHRKEEHRRETGIGRRSIGGRQA